MTTSPSITAVVVTYRSEDKVGAALRALRPAHASGVLRCIVVDNDSPDGTAALVEREFPWVELLRGHGNVGYGRACNLGAARADTPYVLFLNPDVVLEEGAIRTMLEFMECNPRVVMSAPATRTSSGEMQHFGGRPTPSGHVLVRAGLRSVAADRRYPIPGDPSFRTDWLCGAILLTRTAAFREVGGFDPRFFLYFEETDLCVRLSKAGGELWVVATAEAFHDAGSSARKLDESMRSGGNLPQHFYASQYYYFRKHHGWLVATAAEAAEIALRAVRDVAKLLLFRLKASELKERLRGPLFRSPPPPS
jgi:GT2 family glycosyltransferase